MWRQCRRHFVRCFVHPRQARRFTRRFFRWSSKNLPKHVKGLAQTSKLRQTRFCITSLTTCAYFIPWYTKAFRNTKACLCPRYSKWCAVTLRFRRPFHPRHRILVLTKSFSITAAVRLGEMVVQGTVNRIYYVSLSHNTSSERPCRWSVRALGSKAQKHMEYAKSAAMKRICQNRGLCFKMNQKKFVSHSPMMRIEDLARKHAIIESHYQASDGTLKWAKDGIAARSTLFRLDQKPYRSQGNAQSMERYKPKQT